MEASEEFQTLLAPSAPPPYGLQWSKESFKAELKKYHLKCHRSFIVLRTDCRRYEVTCPYSEKAHAKSDASMRDRMTCKFSAMLTCRKTDGWQIRKFQEHTCDSLWHTSDSILPSDMAAEIKDLCASCSAPKELRRQLSTKGFKISASKSSLMFQRGSAYNGTWNYANLQAMCARNNEIGYDTIVKWKTLPSGQKAFDTLFCVTGKEILKTLVPVVSMDGCHLNHRRVQGGKLFLLSGSDILKNYHLIAFAIIPTEGIQYIADFLHFVVDRIPDMRETYEGLWICDRGRALEALQLGDYFRKPNYKTMCAQHLFRNLSTHAGPVSDEERSAFFRCAGSTSAATFYRHYAKLSTPQQTYLNALPTSRWTTYYSPLPRFGILTNNSCESLNGAFRNLGFRNLDAPALTIKIIQWCSERCSRFQTEVLAFTSEALLPISDTLLFSAERARRLFVRQIIFDPDRQSGEWIVSAVETEDVRVLLEPSSETVSTITCECAYFRVRKWWCCHCEAVRGISGYHRTIFDDIIRRPSWSQLEQRKSCFDRAWRVPTAGSLTQPPDFHCVKPSGWSSKRAGRPRTSRMKSQGEDSSQQSSRSSHSKSASSKTYQRSMAYKKEKGWNRRKHAVRTMQQNYNINDTSEENFNDVNEDDLDENTLESEDLTEERNEEYKTEQEFMTATSSHDSREFCREFSIPEDASNSSEVASVQTIRAAPDDNLVDVHEIEPIEVNTQLLVVEGNTEELSHELVNSMIHRIFEYGFPRQLRYSDLVLLHSIESVVENTNMCFHDQEIVSAHSLFAVICPFASHRANAAKESWLNDEIINGFLRCLRVENENQDIALANLSSFAGLELNSTNPTLLETFLEELRSQNPTRRLSDLDVIFAPVFVLSCHWILVVVYPRGCQIELIDSNETDRSLADKIFEWVKIWLDTAIGCESDNWRKEIRACRKQLSTNECGTYLLGFAQQIVIECTTTSRTGRKSRVNLLATPEPIDVRLDIIRRLEVESGENMKENDRTKLRTNILEKSGSYAIVRDMFSDKELRDIRDIIYNEVPRASWRRIARTGIFMAKWDVANFRASRRHRSFQIADIICPKLDVLFPNHKYHAASALFTRNSTEAQPAHRDYPNDCLRKRGTTTYPLFAIIPLESTGARLNVWSTQGSQTRLTFNQGDVFLARGDLVHGGVPYFARSLRLHVYIVAHAEDLEASNFTEFYDEHNRALEDSCQDIGSPPYDILGSSLGCDPDSVRKGCNCQDPCFSRSKRKYGKEIVDS